MNREVVFSPDSEAEVRDAYIWYENRRPGLGADFILCIEEVLDRIRRSPEQYPVVHRGVRRALIRRFPYGIFYLLEEETIVVMAVFHGSRDPKDWRSRT